MTDVSNRDLMVARLVAEGYTDRELAGMLCLSVKAVEARVKRARRRVGARNRADLARRVTILDAREEIIALPTTHEMRIRESDAFESALDAVLAVPALRVDGEAS